MLQNTARRVVGRLLEIRAEAGYRTPSDVDALFAQIHEELATLGQQSVVAVVDWRRCPVMSPEAAARMTERLLNNNEKTLRAAALANNDSPIAVLQFLRLIRESKHAERRLFFDAVEMRDWISEVLTDVERLRLNAFLGLVR